MIHELRSFLSRLKKHITQWISTHCVIKGNEAVDMIFKVNIRHVFSPASMRWLQSLHEFYKNAVRPCYVLRNLSFTARVRTGHIIIQKYLYWFTISFTSLYLACGSEVEYWSTSSYSALHQLMQKSFVKRCKE